MEPFEGLPIDDPRDKAATVTAVLVLVVSMISTYGKGDEIQKRFSERMSELIAQTDDARLSAALTSLELPLRQLIAAADSETD